MSSVRSYRQRPHSTEKPRRTGFFFRQSPLGPSRIGTRLTATLRAIARIWAIVALAGFGVSIYWRGVPFNDTGASWQEPAQIGSLGLVGLGLLLALKWEWLGASLMLVGASGLGILAAIQYQPLASFLPFFILLVPAVLHWLCWQRWQPTYVLIILATVLVVTISGAGIKAQQVYNDFFGPTHPSSDTVIAEAESVNWAWSGAVQTDSVVVKAQLLVEPKTTRLALSRRSDLSNASYADGVQVFDGEQRIYSYSAGGLQPDTEYFYAIEVNGELDTARRGRLQTHPEEPASYNFAFGSCAQTGSNGKVFDTIREVNPRFLLLGGDFYYGNIESNDPSVFLADLTETLTEPAQSALYRSTSIAYIWDDHDYGPNDGDRTSPSREASWAAYTAAVPHFELETTSTNGPIYQAFTVGRVRYILTDLRSERDPASIADGPEKSMLGVEQKAWFKQQLLDAKDRYPVIFWVSSVPWIGESSEGADDWSGYAYERAEIANFITENNIQGLIMLAGDAHMIAFDDGTNSNYSSTPGKGFPVFHAAAFDRRGTTKGGPFSDGMFPGGGHFGEITVIDDGTDQISVTLIGKTWEGEVLVTHTVFYDAPFAVDP